MTRSDYFFKWASYAMALLLTAVLNYHVLTFLPLGAVPALLPLATVAAGILEGPAFGAGLGLAAGVLQTAATHGSPLWIFLFPLAGWVCGLLALYVLRRDLVGYLLAGLAAALLHEALQVLPRLLAGVAELPVLLRVAAPELVWTMVFSLPVYGMCRFCCKHYGRLYHE